MVRSQPNLILSRLTASDFRLIEADLEDVDLPVRKVLEQSHRRIDSVYFPESGFASVVANGAGNFSPPLFCALLATVRTRRSSNFFITSRTSN